FSKSTLLTPCGHLPSIRPTIEGAAGQSGNLCLSVNRKSQRASGVRMPRDLIGLIMSLINRIWKARDHSRPNYILEPKTWKCGATPRLRLILDPVPSKGEPGGSPAFARIA